MIATMAFRTATIQSGSMVDSFFSFVVSGIIPPGSRLVRAGLAPGVSLSL
jgi:hypothetical protein